MAEGSSKKSAEDECIDFETAMTPLQTKIITANKGRTLMLELEAVLVHTTHRSPATGCIGQVELLNKKYFVLPRPHVQQFLHEVGRVYDVMIFTLADKVFARDVWKFLDPEKKVIKYCFHRQHCLFKHGLVIKDLIVLGRPYSRVAIVDLDIHWSSIQQLPNMIPILGWLGYNEEDRELIKLKRFLMKLANEDDFRPKIEERYGAVKRSFLP